MSSETANDLLAELAAERAARAKTVLGETSVLRCAEPVPGPGPQKRQKLPKSGDGKQPAVSAEVVDLCEDSDDEVVEVGRTLVYGDEQWRSEAASLALAQQLQEEDAAADASAALARRLQQEDDAGRAGGVGSGACCSFYSEAFPPWPATVTWTEAQHSKEPNACGNFPICHRKNGSSFFFSGPPLNEHTSHGVLPVPMAGQTITIRRCDGLRTEGDVLRRRPGVDNTTTTVQARTRKFVPFNMGAFRGQHETIELGSGEQVHVMRNFDGRQGAALAAALEGCYGVDILEAKGSGAKCAAAMGNNCQDDYTKLYPPRMFLDSELGELMRPLLQDTMHAVNQDRAARGLAPLSLQRGQVAREQVIGETQVLRFRGRGQWVSGSWDRDKPSGDKMHVHCDRPGTRYVAIMSLGESCTFAVDNAVECSKCFLPSRLSADQWKKIKPNLNCGGKGRGTHDGHGAKEWDRIECASCNNIQLHSGDCLLFFGCPTANVAHGVIATHANTCPPHLPSWCKGARVSTQYRQTNRDKASTPAWSEGS